MRTIIIFLFILQFIPIRLYSQYKVTKEEIYDDHFKEMRNLNRQVNYKTIFDSVIVAELTFLKSHGIDTLGVYLEEYPGSISWDTCQCDKPWISYIQWIKSGNKYQNEITKCCHSENKEVWSAPIIDYYLMNKDKIDKEVIMPVITAASKNKKGEISYEMDFVDHTTKYTIYLELNNQKKCLSFNEFELENESSLFFNENKNSSINVWRKVIKNE